MRAGATAAAAAAAAPLSEWHAVRTAARPFLLLHRPLRRCARRASCCRATRWRACAPHALLLRARRALPRCSAPAASARPAARPVLRPAGAPAARAFPTLLRQRCLGAPGRPCQGCWCSRGRSPSAPSLGGGAEAGGGARRGCCRCAPLAAAPAARFPPSCVGAAWGPLGGPERGACAAEGGRHPRRHSVGGGCWARRAAAALLGPAGGPAAHAFPTLLCRRCLGASGRAREVRLRSRGRSPSAPSLGGGLVAGGGARRGCCCCTPLAAPPRPRFPPSCVGAAWGHVPGPGRAAGAAEGGRHPRRHSVDGRGWARRAAAALPRPAGGPAGRAFPTLLRWRCLGASGRAREGPLCSRGRSPSAPSLGGRRALGAGAAHPHLLPLHYRPGPPPPSARPLLAELLSACSAQPLCPHPSVHAGGALSAGGGLRRPRGQRAGAAGVCAGVEALDVGHAPGALSLPPPQPTALGSR